MRSLMVGAYKQEKQNSTNFITIQNNNGYHYYNTDEENNNFIRQGITYPHVIILAVIVIMIIYSLFYDITSPNTTSTFLHFKTNEMQSTIELYSQGRNLIENIKSNQSNLLNNVFSNISFINYEGTWNSNTTEIGSMKSGLFFLQITLDHKKPHEAVTLVLKAIEGKYIDNWALLYSRAMIQNLIITANTSNSDYYTINGEFLSNIENGKILKNTGYIKSCNTSISLLIHCNNDNSLTSKDHITGSLNTSCGIQLEFIVSKENRYAKYSIIMFYTAIVSSFCLISMLSSFWLMNLIKQKYYLANSFSLVAICQNSIWSIFGSIAHFFLTVNYIQYSFQFGFLTISFILCFILTDIKLLFLIWKIKYKQTQMSNIIIQGNQAYISITLYIMMFCSIFFITKVYFDRKYIIFAVLITWTPQIIYAIVYDSKVFLPSYYILFNSGFRLLMPCYFRGYSNNFFLLAPNGNTVIISMGILIGMIMVLFSQRFHGTRWFMPKKYRLGCEKYKTIEEIEKTVDLMKEECLICLQGMIIAMNNDKSMAIEGDLPSIRSDISKDFTIENNTTTSISNEKPTEKALLLWTAFYFNEQFNYDVKPFYLTSCGHLFHSQCIDPWMRLKEECPKCRCNLNGEYNIV